MSSRKRYDIDILNNYDVLNWQKYANFSIFFYCKKIANIKNLW